MATPVYVSDKVVEVRGIRPHEVPLSVPSAADNAIPRTDVPPMSTVQNPVVNPQNLKNQHDLIHQQSLKHKTQNLRNRETAPGARQVQPVRQVQRFSLLILHSMFSCSILKRKHSSHRSSNRSSSNRSLSSERRLFRQAFPLLPFPPLQAAGETLPIIVPQTLEQAAFAQFSRQPFAIRAMFLPMFLLSCRLPIRLKRTRQPRNRTFRILFPLRFLPQ